VGLLIATKRSLTNLVGDRKEDKDMLPKSFLNDIFAQLADDYGLETILEQNDIEDWQVLELLYQRGLLDVDDYIYTEVEVDDEE
jgi:hypothetical protein